MLKRLLILAFAGLLALVQPTNAAGLYPLSNYQQFDVNGKLLAGAKLYLFDGGTTTPRIGYKDSSLTAPWPNPILADAAGRLPLIYLDDGFYRQRLTTKNGVQIFDQDGIPVLSTTAGGSGTSVDPDSVLKTGAFAIYFDNQPRAGYVRSNGRTIGSAASGATERSNIDCQPLYEWLWAFSNISVTGGKGVSASADFSANKPLVLPNAAGRGLFGMDDLGAGAQNVINTVSAGSQPGGSAGVQARAIDQASLPAYNLTGGSGSAFVSGTTGTESAGHSHTGAGTTGSDSPDHTHALNGGAPFYVGGNSVGVPTGNPAFATTSPALISSVSSGASARHQHAYSFTTSTENATHTHAFSGTGTASGITINSGGSGTAFNLMNPILTVMIYLRL